MTLPIVERAREHLAGRDLGHIFDEAVVNAFELLPAEEKALAGLILADGVLLRAQEITGQSAGLFKMALDNLVIKGLVHLEAGRADLTPAEERLRVESLDEAEKDEEGIPQAKVVFRSLPAQVVALAQSSNNPVSGLARAYSFIFGRRPSSFPVLGRYTKSLGVRASALFFLAHACDTFNGEPLMELLPLAVHEAKLRDQHGFRPEDAPDEEQQKRELLELDEASWRLRLERWERMGGETAASTQIEQECEDGRISADQAAADVRQIRLDYERQRQQKPARSKRK